jgi:hypothetical protein
MTKAFLFQKQKKNSAMLLTVKERTEVLRLFKLQPMTGSHTCKTSSKTLSFQPSLPRLFTSSNDLCE